jgi:hypothetical protein
MCHLIMSVLSAMVPYIRVCPVLVMGLGYPELLSLFLTSCTRPRVAVAHPGEIEEKEERGSARFTYV